ncbi:bifunctional phosphopantothenoylcysteine decarboxylase/phosphopantothenate--cysteine ligase CoaBC [Sediminibacterium sp.]|uniref:bifunctional phosphopantothenoylcysteine decarboxylase/phosphopantothenate--cysteine ligase CoaBC n=1 Tax=Sediminibacterium sp. TaxID=1917865 RepID=UPI002732EC5A|nr:bifunctional phosphopantothenoylcysteine decarboxylase/phosphopantothenate--cysteine ligase CoaBC [Sediminibacterium sp.]MDP3392976.1 bifunctional phosphopantothenoylcysteine decarboxylase/phosphopantothenate--cysteine ligase CoaBC [Sediminibacterium sp.]MDP3567182.1 bifunctional phosphopantothenoylcysteine decarboxylase/phosphopantothenate--cysteine ligase CoaBC [Sediminibacterium sp.]
MISDFKILVGITGSISAYKMYTVIRQLKQMGADIRVIITPTAKNFISPTLLTTFSEHSVYCDFVENDHWQNHVLLGRWANLFLVAPASCNTIAKMANGISDNFLLATYLSCISPVLVLPAMDEDMWLHPSTQRNIELLKEQGNQIVEPNSGLLASGLTGKGRLPEPAEIITYIKENFLRSSELTGKTVLVTAGPTEEPIDPVRVITNRSSGKMGYAIAETLYMAGANVILVSGPVSISPNYTGIQLIKVSTATEMYDACKQYQPIFDIGIFSAAVADYTIADPRPQKIKKSNENLDLTLVKTVDIIGSMGTQKAPHQKIIGFALETENGIDNAKAKLKRKLANLIILNKLDHANTCFNQDKMAVSFVDNEMVHPMMSMTKELIAQNLLSYILKNWN